MRPLKWDNIKLFLAMGGLHVTGIDSQQMADWTVSEDRRGQGDEPDQSKKVQRKVKEKQERQDDQADDGTKDSFVFITHIVDHDLPPVRFQRVVVRCSCLNYITISEILRSRELPWHSGRNIYINDLVCPGPAGKNACIRRPILILSDIR